METVKNKIVFTTKATDCKFKFDASKPNPNSIGQAAGYAIVYGVNTSDRGGYVCRFATGSAKAAPEVHALYCHVSGDILGNTANGTLRLFNDDIGVRCEIDLPDTTTGRDVAALLGKDGEPGYVNGMSFALVTGESQTLKENGIQVVEYSNFIFDEVTITPDPAVIQTTITLQTDDEADEDQPDGEKTENKLDRIKLDRLRLDSLTL